ncbi:MAG: hypothetical protein HY044_01245 [Candidatus Woesebacteria bacterium]|nr:MAG: hypothetical protein HY044_01245 [Candidatus Woesebacteria bacterium]
MPDLTIIMLTQNKVPEKWARYHKKKLLEAAEGYPIITISRKPMKWGMNIIQTEPESVSNVFFQVLRGAKAAKTPYIGIADDDTLYPKGHYSFYRPPMDTFAYNMHRWALFTFGEPTYSMNNRIGNCTMIAPRELTIEALEERYAKFPNGTPAHLSGEMGRVNIEKGLRVTPRKMICVLSPYPVISFRHKFAMEILQKTGRKRMGIIRAYDIPYWGKSAKLVKKFI